jgi:molybdate transport repressor ModE-like protein
MRDRRMMLPPSGGSDPDLDELIRWNSNRSFVLVFVSLLLWGREKLPFLMQLKVPVPYRRAWVLVDTMNTCFVAPLVETLTGGTQGGGAKVTEFGKDVLRRYRSMEKRARRSVNAEMEEFSNLMK